MINPHGFVTIASICPKVEIGNPQANAAIILKEIESTHADIVLFPELCLTGYTCGDLFNQTALIESAKSQLIDLAYKAYKVDKNKLVVIGLPIEFNGTLYNCAAILNSGVVKGIVPKSFIPNYKEFYEKRWFKSGKNTSGMYLKTIPFGTDLLFRCQELCVGVEICEDVWMPIPPSSYQAIAGANVLLNLSASNETVAKAEYRQELIRNQSARCMAAYAYSSAGSDESTSDLVFGGHCMIAENGHMIAESREIDSYKKIVGTIDVQKLNFERQKSSFGDEEKREFREIDFFITGTSETVMSFDGTPFVPKDKSKLEARCKEIFEIQSAGLIRRLKQLSSTSKINIGISGGLDSTLALLVAVYACQKCGWDLKRIQGITMPGFGTTTKTYNNAVKLMNLLNISSKEVDIKESCVQVFKDIGHKPFGLSLENIENDLKTLPNDAQDLVFENVQARVRTLILMSHGFVLGTGDMSELALGWCTYNGDHMSMYNVNCSVPKTLVKFLVQYVANNLGVLNIACQEAADVLEEIINTTISPELLPAGKDGEIQQSTEEKLGAYELHDFFLANFVKHGFSPEKIFLMAEAASFSKKYTSKEIKNTLNLFYRRFFDNQFKRNCVPDGPKVGSVSLSPRGDWRMPSEASAHLWIERIWS
jgi:NAD+ synthase (glutamine-hydrolysing)